MGGQMKFTLQCPRCGGTGKCKTCCPTCDGKGTVTRTETLDFRIKAGTRDGQRIRLGRQGQCGDYMAEPGDLYLIIKAREPSGV